MTWLALSFPMPTSVIVSQKVSSRSQTEKLLERSLRATGMWYFSRTETKKDPQFREDTESHSFPRQILPRHKGHRDATESQRCQAQTSAQIGRYREPEKSQAHVETLIPARGRCFYQNQDEDEKTLLPLAGSLVVPWPSYLRASHLQFSLPGRSFLSS